jgi:hypothetical protein
MKIKLITMSVIMMMLIFVGGASADVTDTKTANTNTDVLCIWSATMDYPQWVKWLSLGQLSTYNDGGVINLKAKAGVDVIQHFFTRNPDALKLMDYSQRSLNDRVRTALIYFDDYDNNVSIWYVRGRGHTTDETQAIEWLNADSREAK